MPAPVEQPAPETAARRSRRVEELLADMSLDEKPAQLVGLWLNVNHGEGVVAPPQDAMHGEEVEFETFARHGLGQITRHYGTRPVDPEAASRVLAARQRWLRDHTRLGIPALAHEEAVPGTASQAGRGRLGRGHGGGDVTLTGPVHEITGSERRLTAVSVELSQEH